MGYNEAMRFKTGVLIGFAAGYYLGAKAGRERYHEIETWLDKARATSAYENAQRRTADLTLVVRERAFDAVPGLREALGVEPEADVLDFSRPDWLDEPTA